MNKFIDTIITKLNLFKIIYWFDSGSLLGIVRDNKFLEWDNDIDLGVNSQQLKSFLRFLNELKKNEYYIVRYYYKNTIFKVKIYNRQNSKSIDINIFKNIGDYMICPQFISSEFLNSNKLLPRLLNKFQKFMNRRFFRKIVFDNFLNRLLRKEAYWVVPYNFFGNLDKIIFENREINIPSNAEHYLKLRYGDWKVRKRNWVFERDDLLLDKTTFGKKYFN